MDLIHSDGHRRKAVGREHQSEDTIVDKTVHKIYQKSRLNC